MPGRRDPIVLVPRFTTLLGPEVYHGPPRPVRAWSRADLVFWRSPFHGATPTLTFKVEVSSDLVVWETAPGGDVVIPSPNTEASFEVTLAKPWMRYAAVLGGTGSGVTLWVEGFAIRRLR
jgi:hypothetical protein